MKKGVFISFEGGDGAGKTTLVRHFLDRVAEHEGAVVLMGKCYEQESVPYKAFDGLVDALSRRQKADGSWVNVNHWLEADPNLVTGYALMALSYCKPRK